jgi:broad specificity phosphatase PhoE
LHAGDWSKLKLKQVNNKNTKEKKKKKKKPQQKMPPRGRGYMTIRRFNMCGSMPS